MAWNCHVLLFDAVVSNIWNQYMWHLGVCYHELGVSY